MTKVSENQSSSPFPFKIPDDVDPGAFNSAMAYLEEAAADLAREGRPFSFEECVERAYLHNLKTVSDIINDPAKKKQVTQQLSQTVYDRLRAEAPKG